jgi:hypothetical protein
VLPGGRTKKASKSLTRVNATCPGPDDELGHVHPSVGCLAVVHPALGLFQALPEFALGEPGFFPQDAKEGRHKPVRLGMLRLGGHSGQMIGRQALDTSSVSGQT